MRRATGRCRANLHIGGREWPLGLTLIALVLFSAAVINLFTKETATISGMAFTGAFFTLFIVSERITARRRAAAGAKLDHFRLTPEPAVDMTALHCAPHNILVPVRDYNTLTHLEWVVSRPETENRDIVVVTLRLLRGPGGGAGNQLSEDELFTDYEQLLFTRVVAVAERCGRNVKLLVAPATNFFDAIVQTAGQLRSDEIVIGESAKMPADQQALLIGDAWDRTPHPRELTTRLVLHCHDGSVRQYSLGAHVPELSPQDVDRIHRLWTEAVKEIGPAVHHRDIVSAALSALEDGMTGEQRAAAIDRLRRQVNSEP